MSERTIETSAQETSAKKNGRSPRGQRMKRLNRYYLAAYQAVSEAVYTTDSTLTVMDHERLVKMLAARMEDAYAGSEVPRSGPSEFRAWAVTWIQNMARVTSAVKAIMPKVINDLSVSSAMDERVLRRVWQFTADPSDADAVQSWTTYMLIREAENINLWSEWIVQYQKSAYLGIWRVLTNAIDLSGDAKIAVHEIYSDFTLWLLEHMEQFREPGAPLHFRLREQAYWFARGWKTNRIRERDEANWRYRVCRDYIQKDLIAA